MTRLAPYTFEYIRLGPLKLLKIDNYNSSHIEIIMD